ncbi:protein CHUP1, chloroplastic-like isoform X2 [Phalaenopsis equestris]|uniref:protein CHUP1, chloroplastic-like isoform X2 n=1 Tax=Phalaenopsis equestris TaxID=78828 RepID=UPI0009E325B5|nr:protein CHUP1, chloroplastic-like isoform X2 [Phalaenopsis equestris]XP_020581099.1 protein CHUP1, chloroplastic-like isoform X2 [Phalaenopsis equestris]
MSSSRTTSVFKDGYGFQEGDLSKFIDDSSTITTIAKTAVGDPPGSRSTDDEEGFLHPEINKPGFKDMELSLKDPEITTSTSTTRRSSTREDDSSMEQEISHLKNLVFFLRERERKLELQLQLQLIEYCGMQEREAALRELESQLKINNMEAKLFGLKVESLQSENQRLQALVLVHSKVGSELEAAKGRNTVLKRRNKFNGEQEREKISSLQQTICVSQAKGQKHGRDDLEIERKLKRLKELEEENESLWRMNFGLVQENFELNGNLDSAQKNFNSVIECRKAEELEEVQNLKQSNYQLLKEIEKLQQSQCADLEELVYLRWVNACLRYELRNYQPAHGKVVARDVSKCLYPISDENGKHLFRESDDVFVEISSNQKHSSKRFKFISKLKRLVFGKEHHCNRVTSVEKTPCKLY